jgi:ceramide glucosyltransferase
VFGAALSVLAVTGVLFALVMWLCQRAVLRSSAPPRVNPLPPVSILKPLKGADEDLAANLETFFHLDHPEYEIVFAAREPDDPALDVARAVMAANPGIPARIVTGGEDAGPNPKVSNLRRAARLARHERLLVSDSNVATPTDGLGSMLGHLEQPGVGLVSSVIRATGGRGLGAAVESFQLNSFVMGGVCAADRVLRIPCVVGKSMLLRRSHLEAIGGFETLARYLAEDQVCGEEIDRLGLRVAVCGHPVDNVLGRLTLADFARRHLRWAKLRRRISARGYAAEILLNPVPFGIASSLVSRSPASFAVAVFALAAMSFLGARAERSLGVRRRILAYPAVELLRSLTVAAVFARPFFGTRVAWRGNEFRIGRRTRLTPLGHPTRRVRAPTARPRARSSAVSR